MRIFTTTRTSVPQYPLFGLIHSFCPLHVDCAGTVSEYMYMKNDVDISFRLFLSMGFTIDTFFYELVFETETKNTNNKKWQKIFHFCQNPASSSLTLASF